MDGLVLGKQADIPYGDGLTAIPSSVRRAPTHHRTDYPVESGRLHWKRHRPAFARFLPGTSCENGLTPCTTRVLEKHACSRGNSPGKRTSLRKVLIDTRPESFLTSILGTKLECSHQRPRWANIHADACLVFRETGRGKWHRLSRGVSQDEGNGHIARGGGRRARPARISRRGSAAGGRGVHTANQAVLKQ